jgi:molybdopterin synthase catalytic subunit
MKVKVRLFASYAVSAGFRSREIDVPEGTTAGGVFAQLRKTALAGMPSSARPLYAVNREHVAAAHALSEGDEIAIFPPVSGGAPEDVGPPLLVTPDPLDAGRLLDGVRHPGCGALLLFEGTVRNENEGQPVVAIDYEAYPEMATAVLGRIRDEVARRWPGVRLALAHRTGRLPVGATSVAVACAAPHRREAFAACRLAMDRIKEALPVWKQEHGPGGSSRWV